MNRNTYTLEEAAQASPTLAALAARAQDSAQRLAAVRDLIPQELHGAIAAGPADDDAWCLLVRGSAAAAKLRQLKPALLAHLRTQGWKVDTLRLKAVP
ncbi:MAG: DciA family protein [Burkholderiaceae bacterium]|jgi:hypothetical protein|nr:DciA family protein [Burkholderiaceae bacterium]